MTTVDNPQARLALLPTFSQPTPPPSPSPDLSPSTGLDRSPGGDGGGGLVEPLTPRPDRPDTRTTTSSGGKPSAEDTTNLVIGIIGLVVVGAAWLVRARSRRRLREPTKTQTRDIAAPLARIGLRHADVSWLNADLADALKAMAAAGAYLGDGPLLTHPGDDAGIPTDLQEGPE